jgi:ABC-type dipeptide/oligopeptide/nickel transport system permease component
MRGATIERVLSRLGSSIFVIFGAVTLVFLVLHCLPGDAALIIAGDDAPIETIDRLRTELGTDKPLLTQYGRYLVGLGTGDLGTSYATGEPVLTRLLAQFPATLALTATATLVAVILGVVLGVISAARVGDWVDQAIQSSILFITSMPVFWVGILLIMVFSVQLQWLPAVGNGSLAHLALPVACLAIGEAARLARMVRNSVLEAIDEPFVTTLRGKGLLEGSVMYRHVLRSALIPVITVLGMHTAEMLGGTVIIETLFARQGLGRLIQEAVNTKDMPMVQGAVLFAAAFYVLINLIVDLSYQWVDRRIEA